MIWLSWISLTCILLYAGWFLQSAKQLLFAKKKSLPAYSHSQYTVPNTTLIVPFKNEEAHIPGIFEDAAHQKFPFEKLTMHAVNDHSEDTSQISARNSIGKYPFHIEVFNLADKYHGKKAALTHGVEGSKSELIVCRDADTIARDANWLLSMCAPFQNEAIHLVIAPVLLSPKKGFLFTFQQMENLALQAMFYASSLSETPLGCSGANMAFRRDSFLKANPFLENRNIPSGDDMFLLQAFEKRRFKQCFINAPVLTPACESWQSMLTQRVRWASKWPHLKSPFVKIGGTLVTLAGLSCLFSLTTLLFNIGFPLVGLFSLIIKFSIDLLLLFLGARIFRQKVWWRWFLPGFILNVFYTPLLVLCAPFLKINWKNSGADVRKT